MEFLLPELIGEENNLVLPDESTEIQSFYNGTTIFITGATGFLGKLLLEKLLTSCPGITKVYALIRLSHVNIHQRIEEFLELKVFDKLKIGVPNLLEKVEFIRGDCSLPNLGLSSVDEEKLKSEIDVIFNCAAVTSCGANLKLAAKVNVMAVRDLLILAQKMKNLKALIHVSTAFANCHRNVLEEIYVKPFISSKALLEFIDSMDPNVYHAKPIVLGKWSNNYIFTKSIAEDVIMNDKTLPVGIVRPSLMVSTAQHPLPGWSDSSNNFTGLLATVYLGLTKVILAKKSNIAQVVPADYVVNCLIATAWDVAKNRALNENNEILNDLEKTPIYNLGISQSNSFTWGDFFKRFNFYSSKIPSIHLLWYPWIFATNSRKLHGVFQLLFHYIPAYIIDISTLPFSNTTSYLSYYAHVDELNDALTFYMLNSWVIKSDNVESLWMKLSQADKELFNFNLDLIDWEIYFYNFIRGIRVYILKDGLESLCQALNVYRKKTALTVFIYALIFSTIFSIFYML